MERMVQGGIQGYRDLIDRAARKPALTISGTTDFAKALKFLSIP